MQVRLIVALISNLSWNTVPENPPPLATMFNVQVPVSNGGVITSVAAGKFLHTSIDQTGCSTSELAFGAQRFART